MGPAWWGAVMGTGIIGTLTQLHAGGSAVGAGMARVFLLAGWTMMLCFAVAFAIRCARNVEVWRSSITGVGAAAWGMVSMGVLAVGAATSTVLPQWAASLASGAWWADGVLWVIGTIIGVVSTFGFTLGVLRHRHPEPRPAWGLAIVPLMVSATCGAPFVTELDSPLLAFVLLTVLVACFVCSLTLGLVIFAVALHHHWRIDRLPLAVSASSWIPLGVVGQSTAAAQVMAGQAPRFLDPEAVTQAQFVANMYGFVMLTVAIPVVAYAAYLTIDGFVHQMPFSPGWWALTFPIGTLSLGAFHLGNNTGLSVYSTASVVAWTVLLGTWTLCAVASLLHLRPQRAVDSPAEPAQAETTTPTSQLAGTDHSRAPREFVSATR